MTEQRKRRVLDEIRIDFASMVDSPAQEGAVGLLMKRADGPVKPREGSVEKRLAVALTSIVGEHQHGVYIEKWDGSVHVDLEYSNSKGEYGHAHPLVKMQDGTYQVGMSDGHTHEISGAELSGAVEEAMTPTMKGKGRMSEQNSTTDELVKRLERAEAVLNFTAAERTHFDGLAAEAQDEFIGKAAADRSAELALAKRQAEDADPVVYTTMDGHQLRKGADGDALIAVMRSNDMIRKDNALLKADSDRQRVTKRVREELPHISGTEDEQVALVKAIEAIEDQAVRDGAFAILKRNDQGLSSIMKTNGSQGGAVEKSANQTLNEKVAKHAADEKISFTAAYAAVMDTSEGNDLYEQMKIEQPVLPGSTKE